MKGILLTLCIFAVSLASCRKTQSQPENAPGAATLYSVRFGLGGLSSSVSGLERTATMSEEPTNSLKDHVHYLNYFIFGSDGKFIRTIKQNDSSPSFGVISDAVPAGDYTVTLTAGKYDLSFGATSTLNTARFLSTATDDDIFFKKLQMTVGSKDVSQTVVLERVVCYLELSLKETLPANVSKVEFVVQNDYSNFLFSTGSFANTGVASEKRVMKSIATEDDRTNVTMGTVVLNDSGNVVVQILCYNATGSLIKEVKVPNVQCAKNKKTLLSGKVFATATGGFSVSLNHLWETDPIAVNF